MIMIGPTQPQSVLASFLNLRRVVTALPISSFFGENEVSGQVASNQRDHAVQQGSRLAKAFGLILESASARFPEFVRLEQGFHLARPGFLREVTPIASSFDHIEPRAIFARGHDAPQTRQWWAFRLCRHTMDGLEIRETVHVDGECRGPSCGGRSGVEDHPRQHGLGVPERFLTGDRRFAQGIVGKAGLAQS